MTLGAAAMSTPEGERRLRLFVAVAVPSRVREQVAQAAELLRSAAPQARWTDPGGWHLTLAFLGWTPPSRVEGIVAALEPVAAATAPFDLTLSGTAGRFGRRVLWAGIEPAPALAELAGGVQQALDQLGYTAETRPFHAHLTLARSRGDTGLPRDIERRYDGPSESWTIDGLELMRSELRRHGARYRAQHRFALGG